MQRRTITTLMVAGLSVALLPPGARALDQPIAAVKLVVKDGSRTQLTFVSKDPAFLFPVLGSGDDPSIGGAVIDLFSANAGTATLAIPPGIGTPGWWTADAVLDAYRFSNALAPGGSSPVRMAVLKQGKLLKIFARALPWPLTGALGAVGVRVTTGSLRTCALFTAPTIRIDVAGRFVARDAIAGALVDCSTVALGGTTTTTSSTTSSSTSSSSSSSTTTNPGPPVCGNGVAEAGEQCDGFDPGVCSSWPLDVRCGAPGGPIACQCCGQGQCEMRDGFLPCCDPDDQCIQGLSNGIPGSCASTLCGTPGQNCAPGTQCEGGPCCAPLQVGTPCRFPALGYSFPCCGGATCTKPSGFPDAFECCSPAGAICAANAECCSAVCNAGGTCDP